MFDAVVFDAMWPMSDINSVYHSLASFGIWSRNRNNSSTSQVSPTMEEKRGNVNLIGLEVEDIYHVPTHSGEMTI